MRFGRGACRANPAGRTYGAGRIANRKTARSQLNDGRYCYVGIGMALAEETVIDHRWGRIDINASLWRYHVPRQRRRSRYYCTSLRRTIRTSTRLASKASARLALLASQRQLRTQFITRRASAFVTCRLRPTASCYRRKL